MANEIKKVNPTKFRNIVNLFNENIIVETVPHIELKQKSKNVKVIIRTGDFTSYSNVLLVSGSGNKWYSEIN